MILKPTSSAAISDAGDISLPLAAQLREVSTVGGDILQADRSEIDRSSYEARFLIIPDAKVVVTEREIFYLTADDQFFPEYYPKPWVYAARQGENGTLNIPVDGLPVHHCSDAVFAPFLVSGNWFHTLADNLARMYYYSQLDCPALPVLLPAWADSDPGSDRAFVNAAFLENYPVQVLSPGIYYYRTVIVPPLANRNDYMVREPLRFVAETLRRKIPRKQTTHPLRLFISRADIEVRNLSNEAELLSALRPFGVMPICPGDFSFRTQLELFSAAQLIIGVHGQGFTPMFVSSRCRRIMEFEAAGWHFTAYRSIASCLEICYEKMPCQLHNYRNPQRFDWLAEADIPVCVKRVADVIASL